MYIPGIIWYVAINGTCDANGAPVAELYVRTLIDQRLPLLSNVKQFRNEMYGREINSCSHADVVGDQSIFNECCGLRNKCCIVVATVA